MTNKESWLKQHEAAGNSATAWSLVAGELLAAAAILDNVFQKARSTPVAVGEPTPSEQRVGPPCQLLRAAGIEALLKARAVRGGHRFVVDGKFKLIPNTEKSGHDLVRIPKETNFPLDSEEEDVLSRLTGYLEFGRYPIGKDWDAGLKEQANPKIGHVTGVYRNSGDGAIIDRLVEKLTSGNVVKSVRLA